MHFEPVEVDSAGMAQRTYALHFAAGFGGHMNLTLFKLTHAE